ncbi:MAG: hypothetical protein JSV42_02540, partial [Chloroflexota bacterium]
RSPGNLYLSILFGGLAFYTYSPGQLVIGLSGVLLLLSDLRYHWENRKTVIIGLGLGIILALPYLRFRIAHPASPLEHLRILDSYWLNTLPLEKKLVQFGSEYIYGLSPGYWFLPNERDLPRHLMKGYGHILRYIFPFAVLGLILAVRNIKSSAYRTTLIALIAAPAGAALVQIGITRSLVLVIPATILIALGIKKTLTWLENRRIPHKALSISLFAVLSLTNFFMLRDVLQNAPTWYQDYGLGGMQYGAGQLFPYIRDYLDEKPESKVILTPGWANGTDIVARFFLGDPLPIQMGSIDGYLYYRQPLDENSLFVMTPDEHQVAVESGKFKDIQIEESLHYPNGEPGFYFVRMVYVDEIDSILAAEKKERLILRSAEVMIDGEAVQVRHSLLDIGEAQHMFDGDPHTLARTFEANPAIVEISYPSPRSISGVSVIIGSTEAEIRAQLYATLNADPIEYIGTFKGTVEQPEVAFDFSHQTTIQFLRLEVRDLHQGEPANVHIWEIRSKE